MTPDPRPLPDQSEPRIIGGIVRAETVCSDCVAEGEALLTWARFYLSNDEQARQFKCDRCGLLLGEASGV